MLWSAVQLEILVTEKVLLEGLRFDLLVELPYVHLLRYIKLLQGYLLQLIVSSYQFCIADYITVFVHWVTLTFAKT